MSKILFIAIALLALLPAIVSATTYYIDATSGNDASSGTSESTPWKTITKANSAPLVPGDQILFKRGETWNQDETQAVPYLYITKSGTATNPITVSAYGTGANPIFRNPTNLSGKKRAINIAANYIKVENINIKDVIWGNAIEVRGNYNTISSTEASNSQGGIAVSGQHNFITRNYLHEMTIPDPTMGYGAVGILLTSPNNEVSYNRVENCRAYSTQFGYDGGFVELYGTVDGTSIHHNWAEGNEGFLEAGSSGGTGTANNVNISYNIAYRTGRFTGIHTTGAEAIYINNWKVDNNLIIEDIPYPSATFAMFYFSGSVLPTQYYLRNNIFYAKYSRFIAYDSNGTFTHQKNIYYIPNSSTKLGFTPDPSEKLADPLFVDVSNANLHLQSASPAIDAGLSLGYQKDFEDNTVPQGSAPDIGAYEYASTSGPKTYYVSTTGSDTNPGTQAQPWRTIQKAANTMEAGDTVIVLVGDYSSQRVNITRSGSAGLPITYQTQGNVLMKGFKITANYVTVKGFEMANTDYRRWDRALSACVYIKGNNVIVEDNYLHDCSLNGIYMYGPPEDPLVTHDCMIRNNKIFRAVTVGIEVYGRNNLIEGNEVWGSVQCHPILVAVEGPGCPNYAAVTGLDADGMRFFGSGHIFRENKIHSIRKGPAGINPSIEDYNDLPHIDCFQTWSAQYYEVAQNIIFERNYCENLNLGMFVFMLDGGANHLTIKNNVFLSAGGINTGGGPTRTDYLYVYNNVWANNLSFGSQNYPNAMVLYNLTHAVVKNNIFYDQPYQTASVIGPTTNIELDYNLAYNSDGTTPHCVQWGNYDTCQPSPNHEMWGVNPLFINPASLDFHLQAGSPAINAGTDLSSAGVTNDYEGNPRPRGAGYDMGAYEYQGTSCAAADINCDNKVDIADLSLVAIDFGKTNNFNNQKSDTNLDDIVDIYDIVYIASRFT